MASSTRLLLIVVPVTFIFSLFLSGSNGQLCGSFTEGSTVWAGQEFFIAFPDIGSGGSDHTYYLQFSTQSNAEVRYSIIVPGSDSGALNGTIKPQNERTKTIDLLDNFEDLRLINSDNINDRIYTGKTVYVRTNRGVFIYVTSKQGSFSYGYYAIPLDALGRVHYAIAPGSATAETDSFGVIVVIATKTRTTVTFGVPPYRQVDPALTPVVLSYENVAYEHDTTFSVQLDRYQAVQIKAPLGDVTGVKVTANQPVAVISGQNRFADEESQGTLEDAVMEMLPPVSTWGTEYVVPIPPNVEKENDRIFMRIKVVTSADNTIVRYENRKESLKRAGYYLDEPFSDVEGRAVYITATKPALVFVIFSSHISNTRQFGGRQRFNVQNVRPAMSLLQDTSQWPSQYRFSTPVLKGSNVPNQYLLLISVKRDVRKTVRIDGVQISDWYDVTGSAVYVTSHKSINGGQHTVSNPKGTVGVTLLAADARTAYALPLSVRFTPRYCSVCVLDPNACDDLLDNDCDGQIDEESQDGKDNDLDGVIDEDNKCANKGSQTPYWLFALAAIVGIATIITVVVGHTVTSPQYAPPH